ncbi:hypothetical protein SFRURICE_014722 [Spodoptera frugiperda]|nr:hypothetical protein SFRURICE_014722 [Spodoptera frugiperda]
MESYDGDEFDFVIAGGGTAGCVLANRLVTANHRVLMLEAGDVQTPDSVLPGTIVYLPKTNRFWNYLAQPDGYTDKCHKEPAMFIPVGNMLGGSSSVNFMIASRGIEHDYHMWATAANDSSWQYKNIVKYFRKSARYAGPISMIPQTSNMNQANRPYMSEEGNIGISQDYSANLDDYIKSFKEMGNKIVKYLGGEQAKGYARGLLTIAEGRRQSTASSYLSPVKDNSNLFVSRRTVVNKVVFDKRKNAIGVRVSIDGGKEIFLKAKKEVIVSAGAIKSPQLLMLSGIGPRNHLKEKNITVVSDLPVGENFQDQQIVTVMHAAKMIEDPGPFNYHLFPASLVLGFRSLKSRSQIPDYATYNIIEERLQYLLQYCGFPFDFQNEICDRSYQQVLGRQLAYSLIVNLYPKSRGKVTLNTTNPDDAPLVETGYFTEEEDMNNMVEYVKDYLPLVNTTYFKKVDGRMVDPLGDKCSMHEYGSDDYWKCYVYCMASSLWNFGGTCAMGSVVDSKLKVYGVQRLRVVDASVMPTVVAGGNYLATVMIAEKASDMINHDYPPMPNNTAQALANIQLIQEGFQTLSLLMLTSYLFPKQAVLKDGDEFDFIIAGGGTAGCVLANRLVTANHRVLVLEAGDDPPYESFLPGAWIYLVKAKSAFNYLGQPDGYTNKCHNQRAMFLPIGKMLGGTSFNNVMIASRGIEHDYQMWATAANDSSWQYKNIVKYIKRSVRHVGPISMNPQISNMELADGPYMGEEGNIGLSQDYSAILDDYIESFKELGQKFVKYLSGKQAKGYARGMLTIAEGYRQSTAFTYLSPVKDNSNLFVSRRTVVNKVVFDNRKNAIGVRVSIDGGKEIFLKAKKEVIVSAGAIKSPQLLMLSGIGPRNHLKEKNITVVSDLPVGENFQDQQAVTVIHAARKIQDPGPFNYHLYRASFMMGFRSLEPCSKIPDYATYNFVQERLDAFLQYCGFPYDFQNDICDRSYRQLMGRQDAYTQIINLYPKSRGKVTLNTTNPDDAPLVETIGRE